MMQIPTDVTLWTYETVLEVVRQHEFEPGQFDYKAALKPTGDQTNRKSMNDSIRRTACSMANADGGFILFGILDRVRAVATPEDRIKGIPCDSDLLKQFSERIRGVQPEIHFIATSTPIRLPDNSDLGILAVYVPRSPRRPHMDETAHIFYRRGDGGAAVEMGYHEVLEQMLYSEERMQKVMIFRLYIQQYRVIIAQHVQSDMITRSLTRFETSAFVPLIADIAGLIPAGLVMQLLSLPSNARSINLLLDKSLDATMHVGALHPSVAQHIATSLVELDRDCALAEQELEKLFGTLGGKSGH